MPHVLQATIRIRRTFADLDLAEIAAAHEALKDLAAGIELKVGDGFEVEVDLPTKLKGVRGRGEAEPAEPAKPAEAAKAEPEAAERFEDIPPALRRVPAKA